MTPPDRHPVRRVVLPSGKTIDVVYFEDAPTPAAAAPEAPAAPPEDALHVCRACGSDLVYPLAWEEAGEERWSILLRCPSCEWTASAIHPADLVESFEEELDRGTERLVQELRSLTQANMEDDIARFSTALAADAILPMDF